MSKTLSIKPPKLPKEYKLENYIIPTFINNLINFIKIAKQVAREKMINYEKYLLESDLERTKFQDTFVKFDFNSIFQVLNVLFNS